MEELKRFDDDNLALEISKCEFFKTEAHWLGHKLSPSGTTQKKTKTETKIEPAKMLKQLRSFMGSINHLSKFVSNAASLTDKLRPLYMKKKR